MSSRSKKTNRPGRAPVAGSRPVLWALMLASMLTVMAGATVAPALPGVRQHFAGVPQADLLVRLVLTLPALAIVLSAPLAGLLVDRMGRKPVLVGAAALYGVSGGSGLVLDNLYALLVGRAVLGVAVAGVMTSATALVADLYAGPARSRVLGIQAAFMGFGGVVFLSLGGLLAEFEWRGPFAIYLAALPVALLVLRVVPEPRTPGAGSAESGAAGEAGARSARVPAVVPGILALALAGQIIFYTVPTQLPFYLRELSGVGAAGSGLAIAAMSLVQALTSLNYRRIGGRLGYGSIAVVTFALMALGMAGLGAASGLPVVLLGLMVAGVGVGLVMPNLNAWLTSCTSPAVRGRALSGITAATFLGQFLSPLLGEPAIRAGGIAAAYLCAAGFAAITALVVALLTRGRGAWPEARRAASVGADAGCH